MSLFSGDYNFSSLLFSCDYNLQFTNTVHYQLLGIRREVNIIQAQCKSMKLYVQGRFILPVVVIPLKDLDNHITELLDACVELIITQIVGALVDVAEPLVPGHQEFNTQHN